jgi:hypothetical protein
MSLPDPKCDNMFKEIVALTKHEACMNKYHTLTISPKQYPGGLRFIECKECSYALAAEVDEHGFIRLGSKIKINHGDISAGHVYSSAVNQ